MREIKFRGKRINIDEWVYGFYFQRNSEDERNKWHFIHDGEHIQYMIKPETIGQYTGLKDKNGKEIYEGDITNHGIVEYNKRLTWDGAGSPHPGFYFKQAYSYGEDGELSYHTGFDDVEILGNIYENPELLEADTHD